MIFEYKVKAKHRLGFKEFKLYATTDIEEFFNRNNIEYVRNMTDTVEHRLFNEIERLNNKLKDIKSQLDYLETYSSKEDVFEDMKRRLDRINKIIGSDKE